MHLLNRWSGIVKCSMFLLIANLFYIMLPMEAVIFYKTANFVRFSVFTFNFIYSICLPIPNFDARTQIVISISGFILFKVVRLVFAITAYKSSFERLT